MASTLPDGIRTMDTRDWNEAARAVTGSYFPHELKPLSPDHRLDLSMRTLDLGSVTIGRLGWGIDVAVDCDYPDAYEVNMPLAGFIESAHNREKVISGVGEGTVFPPDTTTPITRWSRECTVVGVKFDRFGLEREMERVLACPVRSKDTVPSRISARTATTGSWLHFVRTLSADLSRMTELLSNELVRKQISGAITTGFVLAITADRESTPPARPRTVNRVLDRLHEDPARAWTAADMAEVAGASVRRLQEGFREYLGTTPMNYLKDVRLARAHEALRAADDSTTVAEIALRWGFTHTGRFAAAYRQRYGRSPSRTLHS